MGSRVKFLALLGVRFKNGAARSGDFRERSSKFVWVYQAHSMTAHDLIKRPAKNRPNHDFLAPCT